jgi:transposase
VAVYEELPASVREKAPRSNFYRFLEHHGLSRTGGRPSRVVPEIVHEPGEALLIDWGHLRNIEHEGRRIKLWAFVGVLGYSRYMVVRLMTTCDLANTLTNLRAIYETLGGVPRRTTSDNPKVFSLLANKYEALLLRRLLNIYRFALAWSGAVLIGDKEPASSLAQRSRSIGLSSSRF